MLVWWYVDLLPDVAVFYSDAGMLPRGAALSGLLRENRFSLMDSIGSAWGATAFLLVGMTAAAALAVGFRTRIAAILNFVFLLSVHERNILHLDGADTLFRVLSFWLMFAPIGRWMALDARLAGRQSTPVGPAFVVRFLQLQICFVYLYNFANKLGGQKWVDGTALYFTLHLRDFLVRDLGSYLADVRVFTEVGTYLTLSTEACFMPFVLLPFLQPYLRTFGLASGLAFHTGIALLMKVGWFPYLMPATYLLFLEPAWIERTVDLLGSRLFHGGTGGDGGADSVQPEVLDVPPAGRGGRRLLWQSGRLALLFIFASSMWFAAPRGLHRTQPGWNVALVETLGLWQTWDMFSPNPLSIEGHLDIQGTLTDGSTIDLMAAGYGQGGWNPKRPYFDGWYYSRWMKVAERLHTSDWQRFRLEYARAICRRFNASRSADEPQLDSFTITWIERAVPAQGEPEPEWRTIAIWEHHCFE